MKLPSIFIFALMLTVSVSAQQIDVLKNQDAIDWVNMANDIQSRHTLIREQILSATTQEFPPDMMDTLKKYDWLEVANFWYNYNEWGNREFDLSEPQKWFQRYQEDGRAVDMGSFDPLVGDPVVYDEGHSMNDPLYVKEEAGFCWLCWDNGVPTDCMRLVSYKNGVLIIDLSDGPSGQLPPINYKRRIRQVYLQIPKTF
jgi:hypothetical protein